MDQLDGAGTFAIRMQPQIKLTDMSWENILEPHFSNHGQDMLFGVAAIISCRVRPDGKVFTIKPALHVAFQGELGGIKGHAVLDLVRDLPDPVVTLSLRLGILGDASTAQADLGGPTSIFPLIYGAFIVASLFCHVHLSFL